MHFYYALHCAIGLAGALRLMEGEPAKRPNMGAEMESEMRSLKESLTQVTTVVRDTLPDLESK